MDMTVLLGLHKLDYMPLYYLYKLLKKNSIATTAKLGLEMTDTKNSSAASLIKYELITYGFWTWTRGWGF